jgi:hypothetical protein
MDRMSYYFNGNIISMDKTPDAQGQTADQRRGNVVWFNEFKSGIRHSLPIDMKQEVKDNNRELVLKMRGAIRGMERLLTVYQKLTGSTLFNIKTYHECRSQNLIEEMDEPEKGFYTVLVANDRTWEEMLDAIHTIVKEWKEGLKNIKENLSEERSPRAITITIKINAMMAQMDYSWQVYASLYAAPRKKALKATKAILGRAEDIATNYAFI